MIERGKPINILIGSETNVFNDQVCIISNLCGKMISPKKRNNAAISPRQAAKPTSFFVRSEWSMMAGIPISNIVIKRKRMIPPTSQKFVIPTDVIFTTPEIPVYARYSRQSTRTTIIIDRSVGSREVFIFLPIVRDHRHRTAGATSAGSVATKHSACQRVCVRWIALLDLFFF